MKKKKRKLNLILKIIIYGAIIGFLMSVLKQNGLWYKLTTSMSNFNILLYIFMPFVFFFMAILIHELGHLLSFVLSGIKIRALYVLIFIIRKKDNNKWKFEIKLSNIKLLGGLVVPNLPSIEDDIAYNSIKNKFTKALIAGPIISIIYFVISLVTFLLVWILTTNLFWTAFLLYHLIFNTLMTILIIASSKINTDSLYGDFVAHDKFKNDEVFVLSQINQYMFFSLLDTKESNDYIFSRIIKEYEFKQYPSYNIFDLSLVSSYLSHTIEQEEVDHILSHLIRSYNINKLSSSKNGLEITYLISAYYYRLGEYKKCIETFEIASLVRNRHYSDDRKEFLNKQYEHLLNLSDNSVYLKEHIDILLQEFDLLLPVINVNKITDEIDLRLPLNELVTEWICYI